MNDVFADILVGNVGSMPKADTDVGTGLVGAPACGDVMKLQIRVDPNDNTVRDTGSCSTSGLP